MEEPYTQMYSSGQVYRLRQTTILPPSLEQMLSCTNGYTFDTFSYDTFSPTNQHRFNEKIDALTFYTQSEIDTIY